LFLKLLRRETECGQIAKSLAVSRSVSGEGGQQTISDEQQTKSATFGSAGADNCNDGRRR
jgi:hypothetical protein